VPTLSDFSGSIDEGATSDRTVGNITVSNSGDTNITGYTLSANEKFKINSSGEITTKEVLDYETDKQYTLKVTATNDAGKSNEVSVTINITNVADVVPSISDFTGSIDEGDALDRIVGNITVSDSGDSTITKYTLSGTTKFQINSSGVIKTKEVLDYEGATKVYSFKVVATNDAGDSNEASVTINITNVAETVPTLSDFLGTIDEGDTLDRPVGKVTVSDSGDTTITKYTLNGTTKFKIDSNGAITTQDKLDFESGTTAHSFKVFATNGAGNSNEATVKISINDVEDVVPSLSDFLGSIDEGDTVDRPVGKVSVSKSGDSNITGYTLSGTTKFQIDNNGAITTKEALDFESGTTTHSFKVVATSGAGNSNEATVTININDVADVKPTLTAFTNSIDENTAIGTEIWTICFNNSAIIYFKVCILT
jgi:uncharacterized protein (AIM24 family)